MSETKDKIIEELVSLVLIQSKEIEKLNRKIKSIGQYIDVYEEYIKRGND